MPTVEQLGTPLPPIPGLRVPNPEVRSLYLAMAGLAQANPGAEWPKRVLASFREFLRSREFASASPTLLLPALAAYAVAYQTARALAKNKGSDYDFSALRVAAGDVYASMDEFERAVTSVYQAVRDEARGALSALVVPLALAVLLVWAWRR